MTLQESYIKNICCRADSFKHYKHLSAGPILLKESTSAVIYRSMMQREHEKQLFFLLQIEVKLTRANKAISMKYCLSSYYDIFRVNRSNRGMLGGVVLNSDGNWKLVVANASAGNKRDRGRYRYTSSKTPSQLRKKTEWHWARYNPKCPRAVRARKVGPKSIKQKGAFLPQTSRGRLNHGIPASRSNKTALCCVRMRHGPGLVCR